MTLSHPTATSSVLVAIALALVTVPAVAADDAETMVRELLHEVPLIDGHNDVPWQYRSRTGNRLAAIDLADTGAAEPRMHTDFARLEEGGVGAQFWSVYIPTSLAGPGAARVVLEQIDVVHRLTELYPERLELALTAADVVRIHAQGRIASLIGIEGGHSIEASLGVLRQLHRTGARYMTLTHSDNTRWADSSTDDPEHGGLAPFGRSVVREMNRLGMLVDLSHVSPETMHDALDVTRAPVIFSHSSAFALTRHPRNVPDQVLDRLPTNGGVVMVTFVPPFVSEEVRSHSQRRRAERDRLLAGESGDEAARRIAPELARWDAEHPAPRATLDQVADHIVYIRDRIGIDHVGIGSDFDGISSTPLGLEDVSTFPALLVELVRRGFDRAELERLAGRNLLRVMREAERVAWTLQAREEPIDETFGEGSR